MRATSNAKHSKKPTTPATQYYLNNNYTNQTHNKHSHIKKNEPTTHLFLYPFTIYIFKKVGGGGGGGG
ncbi:hypothetical protein ACVGWR_00090, partial [Enterobacter hormaechei]